MQAMTTEQTKKLEETQARLTQQLQLWTATYLDYLEAYTTHEPHEINEIAYQVRTLALAALALNGIDTYECNE